MVIYKVINNEKALQFANRGYYLVADKAKRETDSSNSVHNLNFECPEQSVFNFEKWLCNVIESGLHLRYDFSFVHCRKNM